VHLGLSALLVLSTVYSCSPRRSLVVVHVLPVLFEAIMPQSSLFVDSVTAVVGVEDVELESSIDTALQQAPLRRLRQVISERLVVDETQ
jgi:hypothetical protein